MKESDYLVILVTNQQCGVCTSQRGNGIIGNKHPYMEFEMLKNLLIPHGTSGEKSSILKMINIHYTHQDGKRSNIQDISRFSYRVSPDGKGEPKIIQEKIFNFKGKTRIVTIEMDKNESPEIVNSAQVQVDDGDDLIDWKDYTLHNIPAKLENYTGFFAPMVLVTTKTDWKKSLKTGNPLKAMSNMGFVMKVGDDYMMDRTQDPRRRGVKFEDMMIQLKDGSLSMEPHVVRDEPSNKTSEVIEKKAEAPKKNEPSYRIRYYDDTDY